MNEKNDNWLQLPAEIQMHATNSGLVASNGQLVAANPIVYPDFFVDGIEVNAWAKTQGLEGVHYSFTQKVPAIINNQGLAMDRRWEAFGAFLDPDSNNVPGTLVNRVDRGECDWFIKCPVMKGPESMIGQLIRRYGKSTGGDLNHPGLNQCPTSIKFPIVRLLRRASQQELQAFQDRDRSLLDLACEHQQWALAEWLWGKGVQWSQHDLERGIPLAGLTIAGRALQGSLVFGGVDDSDRLPDGDGQARVDWMRNWLERYKQAGGQVATDPGITWRGDLAVQRGMSEYGGLIDTPLAFWITRFIEIPAGGRMRLPDPETIAPHARELVYSWVDFWTDMGLDIEQEPIMQSPDLAPLMGFSSFWKEAVNGTEWSSRLRARVQERNMEQFTGPAARNATSKPRRL